NTVQGHFDHPDGTFTADNASNVFGSTSSTSSVPNLTGTSTDTSSSSTGTGVGTRSLHFLGNPTISCAALDQKQTSGSCACPNGGDFQYQIEPSGGGGGGDSTAVVRAAFTACSANDVTIDGKEFAKVTTSQAAGTFSMFAVLDLNVQKGGQR